MKIHRPASLLFAFCLLYAAYSANAQEIFSLSGDSFYLDLPGNWTVADEKDNRLSFISPDGAAFYQIKHESMNNRALEAVAAETIQRMSGKGEGTSFLYHDAAAWFGSFTFSHEGTGYTSYLMIVNDNDTAFIMIAFAPDEVFPVHNDYLVSIIDSFSLPAYSQTYSGPVGSFDRYFSTGPVSENRFTINDINFSAQTGPFLEAQQFVSDREARILNIDGTIDGWKRFYRMIFRDGYQDILPVARSIEHNTGITDKTRLVTVLLDWIQGFTYERSGTMSDIHPMLYTAIHGAGDCDSRALLYLGLLHYFDIDGILLVSTVYMHSLAAVYIPYNGAGYEYMGKKYIIAETTEKVDFGLIASDMANPDNWIPVILWEQK